MDKDTTSTLAGGAAGLLMLQQVQWDKIPAGYGELVKVLVALSLIGFGAILYSKKGNP